MTILLHIFYITDIQMLGDTRESAPVTYVWRALTHFGCLANSSGYCFGLRSHSELNGFSWNLMG